MGTKNATDKKYMKHCGGGRRRRIVWPQLSAVVEIMAGGRQTDRQESTSWPRRNAATAAPQTRRRRPKLMNRFVPSSRSTAAGDGWRCAFFSVWQFTGNKKRSAASIYRRNQFSRQRHLLHLLQAVEPHTSAGSHAIVGNRQHSAALKKHRPQAELAATADSQQWGQQHRSALS